MKRSCELIFAALLASLAVGGSLSCAVDGGVGSDGSPAPPPSVTAAMIGLPAHLRVFHDELEPHGDWVLIEPHGWVFRPRVNTVAWRPYRDGRWEPSYSYGWVWQSDEPFGWITDHYGFWFHDEFQGWVWQPYGAWAPAWVAWVQVGDYIGWAPLPPETAPDAPQLPDGVFTYVSRHALAGAGAATRASFVRDIPDDPAGVRPIDRISSFHGVYWNAGPDPAEILGPAVADRLRMDEREGRLAPPPASRQPLKEPPPLRLSFLEERTTWAWSLARREFLAERSRRQGAGPGDATGGGVPPRPSPPADSSQTRYKQPRPGVSPAGTPAADSAAADSLRRSKRAPRPGAPRPTRPGPPR